MNMDEKNAVDIRQEVDAIVEKMHKHSKLSEKDSKRLKELSDTGDLWAQYQFAVYLFDIENQKEDAVDIWKSLAEKDYPLAIAKLGDYYYYENAPENWDAAYMYYTGEDALPLSGKRKTAIKDILNHGKFNKRVLIMSMIFAIVSIAIMLLTSSFVIFHINPIVRIIFIILNIAVVIQGIRLYRINAFHSLRWMMTDFLIIWCIYLFIWLM